MKKLMLIGLLMFGFSMVVRADGTLQPVLSPNTTGGQYFFPTTPAPAVGGVLVNNGSVGFQWSNATVASTSTTTSQQFPTLANLTLTQIQGASGIIPAATGQIVMCNNCNSALMCISTGSANAFQWVAVSSSTATGATVCK